MSGDSVTTPLSSGAAATTAATAATGDLDALGRAIRARLGPPPHEDRLPRVSVVVVSHDGADHLRTLIAALADRTDYPDLELIVVDNGSADDTLAYLRGVETPFPLSIAANPHNESFSDANNQGAELATGELVLLLNNDVEPFEPGWLRELVACLRRSGAGAVGATLIYPYEGDDAPPHGFRVQHRGLRFRDEDRSIHPALHDWGADPLDAELGRDVDAPVVVAACVMLEASLFERIGGLTRGYRYGSEDIDFCLKVRADGHGVVCSGRSVLAHRPGSTRRVIAFEDARDRKRRNHRLLLERWGPRLRREHDLDALRGGGMWVQAGREHGAAAATPAEAEAPGVCVELGHEPGPAIEAAIRELEDALQRRGQRCIVQRGEDVDALRGLDHDVAIHLAPARYVLHAGRFNVLWAPGSLARLADVERRRYQLVATADADSAERLEAACLPPLGSGARIHAESLLRAAMSAFVASGFPTRIDSANRKGG
jgi:GT2 family glycosyltransferase